MKGIFRYTGIRVKDMEESVKFYTELLGMELLDRTRIEATEGEVATVVSEKGGPELELNYYPMGNKYAVEYIAGEGLDHLGFRVEDLDAAIAELAKAGYPVVHEVKTEKSRWAYVQDPNGIYIEIFA